MRQALLAVSLIGLLNAAACAAFLPFAGEEHQLAASSEGTVLKSALGWIDCQPALIHHPSSTDEVADVVMNIFRESRDSSPENQLQRYLVRATHQDFYTHNNFSCARTHDTSVLTVALDMSNMKQMLKHDEVLSTVTVQAGMTFSDLEETLLDMGLSLPGIVVSPHLAGMTLGGVLATASHGTSLVGPATIAPFIRSAVLVDGTGEALVLDSPGSLLEGSLGLLGVITELTLEVTPAKKVAVKQLQEEDVQMATDLREIIESSQAAALDVTWSPAAGMYTARVWHEAEPSTPGDARSTILHTDLDWLDQINVRLHHDQLDMHDHEGVMCEVIGDLSTLPTFSASAVGEETDIYGVSVGWINHMAGTDCDNGHDCFWRRAKWTPNEFSIRSEDFAAWVEDAKDILSHARGCPSFLFNFRFILGSESQLAMHSGKQVVAIEISTHSSSEARRGLPVKQQALLEEIVQMTMCKYSGRPHWALATNRMFTGPCPVRDMYGTDFDAFLAVRPKYDPHDIFLSPLFASIMAREAGNYYPGCAMDGECFCLESSHCGPGHVCAPGAVFPQYNVCRLVSVPDEL